MAITLSMMSPGTTAISLTMTSLCTWCSVPRPGLRSQGWCSAASQEWRIPCSSSRGLSPAQPWSCSPSASDAEWCWTSRICPGRPQGQYSNEQAHRHTHIQTQTHVELLFNGLIVKWDGIHKLIWCKYAEHAEKEKRESTHSNSSWKNGQWYNVWREKNVSEWLNKELSHISTSESSCV